MAADGPKSGYLGNLNKDQEVKLQTLWAVFLKASESTISNEPSDGGTEQPATPTQTQRRHSLLSRSQSNVSGNSPATSQTYQQHIMVYLEELGAGAAESTAVQKALSVISPTELRIGVLDTLKHDHPDAMMLRFLRARKWDVPKAFAMMMEAIVWRVKEMHVDDDVMEKGELHALKQTQNTSSTSEQKAGKDFLSQMRMGKSYVHGVDRVGRPIVVVRVRLHKPGAQTEESLERYIVHVIESVRLTMSSPVETAAVLFDMTGFGLSNMEYPPVRFILKCFEANYPESLGIMLIHKAPWVFSGIWRLIRGWMDPEIAAKVQFTNSISDLERFIPRNQIVKEMGGTEEWSYEYIEPSEGENAKMKDTTTRDALKAERQRIGDELLSATSNWIDASKSKDAVKIQSSVGERNYLVERLSVNHWKLDPYVRARLCLDRMNVIQHGGNINFYPNKGSIKEIGSKNISKVEHLEKAKGTAVGPIS